MKNNISILVINGPNLKLTGTREPQIYGSGTNRGTGGMVTKLDAAQIAMENGIEVKLFQSNHEGDLIDRIHSARPEFDGIILNAGAFTHYSYALRDAIASVAVPTVEVHMSNVDAREDFRRISVIGPVCIGSVSGFGSFSYHLALAALIERFKND